MQRTQAFRSPFQPTFRRSIAENTPSNATHKTPQGTPGIKRVGGSTRLVGAGLAALGIIAFLSAYPSQSPTGNPIETVGSQNVSNRFNKGGSKDSYTPGVATDRTQQGSVSSLRENEHEADARSREHLMAKNYKGEMRQ